MVSRLSTEFKRQEASFTQLDVFQKNYSFNAEHR